MSLDQELLAQIDKYKEIMQKDPDSREFLTLADLYRKLGVAEEATNILKEGLNKHPDYVAARLAIARIFLTQGQVEDATREFEEVIRQDTSNFVAFKLLGEIAMQKQEHEKAADRFGAAYQLKPDDQECKVMLDYIGSLLGRDVTPSPGGGGAPAAAEAPPPSGETIAVDDGGFEDFEAAEDVEDVEELGGMDDFGGVEEPDLDDFEELPDEEPDLDDFEELPEMDDMGDIEEVAGLDGVEPMPDLDDFEDVDEIDDLEDIEPLDASAGEFGEMTADTIEEFDEEGLEEPDLSEFEEIDEIDDLDDVGELEEFEEVEDGGDAFDEVEEFEEVEEDIVEEVEELDESDFDSEELPEIDDFDEYTDEVEDIEDVEPPEEVPVEALDEAAIGGDEELVTQIFQDLSDSDYTSEGGLDDMLEEPGDDVDDLMGLLDAEESEGLAAEALVEPEPEEEDDLESMIDLDGVQGIESSGALDEFEEIEDVDAIESVEAIDEFEEAEGIDELEEAEEIEEIDEFGDVEELEDIGDLDEFEDVPEPAEEPDVEEVEPPAAAAEPQPDEGLAAEGGEASSIFEDFGISGEAEEIEAGPEDADVFQDFDFDVFEQELLRDHQMADDLPDDLPEEPAGLEAVEEVEALDEEEEALIEEEFDEGEAEPDDDLPDASLAELYIKQDLFGEATSIYQKLLQHDPGDRGIKQLFEETRALQAYVEGAE